MRRRKILIIIGVMLLVLGAFAFFPSGEPSYQGRSLSAWMDDLTAGYHVVHGKVKMFPIVEEGLPLDLSLYHEGSQTAENRATNALYHIGPEAMPYLVQWLDYTRPAWNERLCDYLAVHCPRSSVSKRIIKLLDKPSMRCEGSYVAFKILGTNAAEAVPGLTKILNHRRDNGAIRASRALAHIGPKGLAPLMAALADPAKTNREEIADSIGMMGSLASNALPLLSNTAIDPDPATAKAATNAIRRIQNSWEKLPPDRQELDTFLYLLGASRIQVDSNSTQQAQPVPQKAQR